MKLRPGDTLVVASHNPGKVREIMELLAPYRLHVIGAKDLELEEPEETEDSFAGNAALKARWVAERSGHISLADDSGLSVAALDGAPGIWAVAGDTDGIDGMDEIAGAMLTPDTLSRACAKGLDARAMLAGHDSHGFFEATGDLIITGPTLTNVNDIRAILIA